MDVVRITELQPKTYVEQGDYIAIDNQSDGTKKVQFTNLLDDTLSQENKIAPANVVGDEIATIRAAVGSPLKASTVAQMTDTNKIYVYVGSESGYTNGNWYYWNGSAWTSGGVYNSVAVETDPTLTVSGMPADAKVTGDKLSDLESDLSYDSMFIMGQGNTYIEPVYFDNVKAGSHYRVHVIKWSQTGITPSSSAYMFRLGYTNDGTITYLSSFTTDDTLGSYYDIMIPSTAINPTLVVSGRVENKSNGILRIENIDNAVDIGNIKLAVEYYTLAGLGNTYTTYQTSFKLNPGFHYRVHIKKWEHSGLTQNYNTLFTLYYKVNDNVVEIVKYYTRESLPDYYDFVFPDTEIATYLWLGGRVTNGNDGMITIECLDNLVENKLNSYTAINFPYTGRINALGSAVSDNTCKYSDYIQCEAGTSIEYYGTSFIYQGDVAMSMVAFYDESKAFISSVTKIGEETANKTGTFKTIAPANTAYIRGSIRINFANSSGYYLHIYNRDALMDTLFVVPDEVSFLTEHLGVYENTFKITAGSAHSSTLDRISVNIKQGEEFSVYSSTDTEQTFNVQWYGVLTNDTGTRFATLTINTGSRFVATNDFKAIGIYIGAQTEDNTITMTVKTNIALATDDCVSASSVLRNTFNSAYTTQSLDAKVKEYCALFVGSEEVEPFLFFTDPHFYTSAAFFSDGQRANFEKYMPIIQKAYNSTPVSFCMCGGDWLTNDDTPSEACAKLGYMDAITRDFFKVYYPILGNHDTNYQGVDDGDIPRQLSNQTIANLMFRDFGRNYYTFKTQTSRFYIFDSGIDWVSAMSEYRWGQVDWFAEQLGENDDAHSVIGIHIVTNQSKASWEESPSIQSFADNLTLVAQAYNGRQTITLNEVTYDFTSATGKVEFVISGHTHWDGMGVVNGIPTMFTTQTKSSGLATFDLIYADYTNRVVKTIRVGDGENRTMSLV